MSNWTSITAASVKTAKNSAFLAAMQAKATANGEADPLPKLTADVVARIRAACSTGNALDVDVTKVPNSLEGLALRMIVRGILSYIGTELTQDERDERKEDGSYLNRIMDQSIRFERPDNSAGSGEMQSGGSLETVTGTPRQNYTREGMGGLL